MTLEVVPVTAPELVELELEEEARVFAAAEPGHPALVDFPPNGAGKAPVQSQTPPGQDR